jgi:hypothetical protein
MIPRTAANTDCVSAGETNVPAAPSHDPMQHSLTSRLELLSQISQTQPLLQPPLLRPPDQPRGRALQSHHQTAGGSVESNGNGVHAPIERSHRYCSPEMRVQCDTSQDSSFADHVIPWTSGPSVDSMQRLTCGSQTVSFSQPLAKPERVVESPSVVHLKVMFASQCCS